MSLGRASPSSLRQAWESSFDLLSVVAVVVLTDFLLLRPALGDPLVRAVIGLLFVVFVPGYALVSALFPETERSTTVGDREGTATGRFSGFVGLRDLRQLSGTERVALSFGLSLAFVPLVVVVLTLLPLELGRVPVFLTISGVTVACAGVAAVRRWTLPRDRRFRVPIRAWLVAGRRSVTDADSRFDALLNVGLAVAVVLAIGALGVAILAPPDGEAFTEFTVLTENGDGELVAADYPRTLSPDRPRTIQVGVENHEHESVEYTVVVQLQRLEGDAGGSSVADRLELDRFSTRLGHNETSIRERELTVSGNPIGDRHRLLFLLYVGDVPETPTRDDAYRNLRLWIEWEGASPDADGTDSGNTASTE
jgi:uncharacterized membrane protein